MTVIRLDRASVGALAARAAMLLAHVREREAFHARVLAERLCASWLAPSMSLDDLVSAGEGPLRDAERAHIRALLRSRADHVRSRSPRELGAGARIVDLLGIERLRAEGARDDLAALLRAAEDEGGEPCGAEARAALMRLAGALAVLLELRILAERAGDPERADRLDAERDRWIALARGLSALDRRETIAAEDAEVPSRLRPLAGRVVLSVARAHGALGRLSAMLEDAGATTVLASSAHAAHSLARWFHVDAALCVIEGPDDPLLTLAAGVRATFGTSGRAPLLVALLAGRGSVAPEVASSSGFDAAFPIDAADLHGLWISVSVAIQAHRVGAGRCRARRARTGPGASV